VWEEKNLRVQPNPSPSNDLIKSEDKKQSEINEKNFVIKTLENQIQEMKKENEKLKNEMKREKETLQTENSFLKNSFSVLFFFIPIFG